jgi:hypothetical protein
MPKRSTLSKTEDSKHIIKSLKNSYLYKNENVEMERKIWERDYSGRIHDYFSVEDLLSPGEYSCQNSSHANYNVTSNIEGVRIHEFMQWGFWSLVITEDCRTKSKHHQRWDFTIDVKVGNRHRFHPLEVKKNILHYHSEEIYQQWRHIVLDDLKHFALALEAFNPPCHIVSTACSRSSERVCRMLNLHVSDGRVFLLHKKNRACAHKNGTFPNLISHYSNI